MLENEGIFLIFFFFYSIALDRICNHLDVG